jgi:hypothetical protein
VGARQAGATPEEIEATLTWVMAIRAGMVQSLFRRAEVKARQVEGA